MHTRSATALVFALFTLMTTPTLAEKVSLNDCFNGTDASALRVCRLQILAAYQAMQFVQARHGLTQQSCQLGADPDAEQLVETLKDDLLGSQARNPELPLLGLAITALSTSRQCPRRIAGDFGGQSAVWLLTLCKSGLKNDDEMSACVSYIGALFESLNLMSGWKGGDNFMCPPKRGVQVKTLLNLLIDEAISNPSGRRKPAVEVMANALMRQYPCHFVFAASDDDFEANYAAATEQACCGESAKYDHDLGEYFQSSDAFRVGMNSCLKQNPGAQSVRGYFSFTKAGTYRLVLQPEGKFSSCVSSALEGQSVPRPPRLPFLNAFTFSTAQ